MKNTNKNKNKYSIIFALCSMLSYGVYGAASSSDLRGSSMSSEGPQNISEQQNRKKEFYCYTRKDIENFARNRNDAIYLIYFPIRSYEKLEGEIQISNISGTVISSKLNDHNLFYAAEIDACLQSEHKSLSDYCEIKTQFGKNLEDLNFGK